MTDCERLILYASGSNSNGQLGVIINNEEDITSFEKCHEWNQDQTDDNNQLVESINFISSSIGGRHSLFLIKSSDLYSSCYYLYSCGDSSQGQLVMDSTSKIKNKFYIKPSYLPTITSTSNQKNIDSNIKNQFSRLETLNKINYFSIISKVSNIKQDFKSRLLQSYQPIQVTACWETSFIVLSHTNNLNQTNKLNYNLEQSQQSKQINDYNDYIIAFGSDNFNLRGSNNPIEDLMNPNLVDLPKSKFNFNSIQKIKLFSGCQHVIAMIQYHNHDGNCFKIELIGWGATRHGQLGPIQNYSKLPNSIKPEILSISIPKISDCSSIKIALGNQHTVIVCSSKIWCWGTNRNHQIPPQLENLEPNSILELQASWNATFVLTSTDHPGFNKLLAFGNNLYGQLGVEDKSISYVERLIESSYSQLSTGSEHVLILKGDHQVWGWGWNEHGNLSKEKDSELQPIRPFGLIYQTVEDERIAHVTAGCATSFLFCKKEKTRSN